MEQEKKNLILIALLGLYFLLSLFFLNQFPFMHSDESWLSGLTRTMMHEGMDATESFFDLLPRYPHAIKTLFHIIQMPFILVFGYSLFAVRLISLLIGTAFIYLAYRMVLELTQSKPLSILAAFILGFDVQFIYASHFARQEIFIACGILFITFFIIKNIYVWSYKQDLLLAVFVGILIGVHPNAFIAALIAGSLYLYYLLADKKLKWINLYIFVAGTSVCAFVYIGISYLFDPQFIPHYLNYGDHLGVTKTLFEKINALIPFYQKLWLGVSGTYYTPFVKVQMVLFGVAMIAGVVYSFWERRVWLFLLPILAINIGYIIIGRFSQPSILFVFVACWMLIFYLISRIKRFKILAAALLLALVMVVSFFQIKPYLNRDYKGYIERIESVVPEHSSVLANLNTGYAFAYDALRDYRNLGCLEENQMTFSQYVQSNDIEYIIYPEEMDYIYEARPVWNIVYGNLYPYYEDMQDFILNDCELISSFDSPYAMRITSLMDKKDWSVKIYKVKQ